MQFWHEYEPYSIRVGTKPPAQSIGYLPSVLPVLPFVRVHAERTRMAYCLVQTPNPVIIVLFVILPLPLVRFFPLHMSRLNMQARIVLNNNMLFQEILCCAIQQQRHTFSYSMTLLKMLGYIILKQLIGISISQQLSWKLKPCSVAGYTSLVRFSQPA